MLIPYTIYSGVQFFGRAEIKANWPMVNSFGFSRSIFKNPLDRTVTVGIMILHAGNYHKKQEEFPCRMKLHTADPSP